MGKVIKFTPKIRSYDKNVEVKILLARAAALLDEMGDKERRVGWLVSECAALLKDVEDSWESDPVITMLPAESV